MSADEAQLLEGGADLRRRVPVAGLIGVWGDFRYTAFAIVALQVTWTLFCIIRLIQLRRGGADKDRRAVL